MDPLVEEGVSAMKINARRWAKALKLLREAMSAINNQLYAAGPDEVKQHPILRANDRLTGRIERFLKS